METYSRLYTLIGAGYCIYTESYLPNSKHNDKNTVCASKPFNKLRLAAVAIC